MPRENSISDEASGRSLTPDLDDELAAEQASRIVTRSPTHSNALQPDNGHVQQPRSPTRSIASHPDGHVKRLRPVFASTHHGAATPADKFRSTVRKVIQMHRTASYISGRTGGIGSEPGIDPRRASAYQNYGHIKQECLIEVVDYSSVRSSFGRMTNKEFVSLMNDASASRKESWVKARWINIGGVSWDVISAVAIKYDLHPLSLEDVLNSRSHNRSKVDYYHKHMFLRVLCHSLTNEDDAFVPSYGSTLTDLPRSSSPIPFSEKDQAQLEDDEDGTMYDISATGSRFSTKKMSGMKRRSTLKADVEKGIPPPSKHRLTQLADIRDAAREKRTEEEISIDELKKGQRVNVKVQPIFIFLTRCGTVISIHPTPNLNYTAPISARLRQVDTGLRKSADPSLLVQSLLDLIVDEVMEVVDEYQTRILQLEHDILLKPKIKTVQHLHILSGDLILHKRTLEPIKTIIYGLRRYDVDRCAALIDQSTEGPNVKVVGFMSHKAKIYLADVFDHMEYVLTSLDMFSGVAENLINYTFNMSSYEMNVVMRRLTLATIIFLPLTLLTGYFGMNFDFMWSINHGHTDAVFWAMALPLMMIVIPIFTWRDILGMIHYINKRMAAQRAVRMYKQA